MTGQGTQPLFGVHIKGLDETIIWLVPADDLVGAVMRSAEHLGKLNDAMRRKFPEMEEEDEFVIDAVHKSEAVLFSDEWMQEYVDGYVEYGEDI
jgi:hypothetical protein